VGVAAPPVGEGGAGGVAGQPAHTASPDDPTTVAGANGAVVPAGNAASQPASVAARPLGAESGRHGSSLSTQ